MDPQPDQKGKHLEKPAYVKVLAKPVLTVLLILMALWGFAQSGSGIAKKPQRCLEKQLQNSIKWLQPYTHLGKISLDSIKVFKENHKLSLHYSASLAHIPINEGFTSIFKAAIRSNLRRRYKHFDLEIWVGQHPIEHYIPNLYRDQVAQDSQRIRPANNQRTPLLTHPDKALIDKGLLGNHIALWHSHGLYFNHQQDRWQWQRARLFGTVEDLYPLAYTLQYLAPMLENAGALTFLPRERDFQTQEIIVDNDLSSPDSEIIFSQGLYPWETIKGGFLIKDTLFDGENPFQLGSHLQTHHTAESPARLTYLPAFQESGWYAVYISWADSPANLSHVDVRIYHSGGHADLQINQTIAAATWVYLGTYHFLEGRNPQTGSLVLSGPASQVGTLTADAVRFGGGMGNVARRNKGASVNNQQSAQDRGQVSHQIETSQANRQNHWKTSGFPHWAEGSRYFLQYAGMPDTLVYSLNKGLNDYNDDFQSRGEWVNFLLGAPLGPEGHRQHTGLGIPIDMALAFHTDAGITPDSTVIGTLAIFSTQRDAGFFPDSISRMASRDLAQIIQDQIIQDIQYLYNPLWKRRALWDRQYSEAWRPNVPTLLLELLSHQNLSDMRYGLDPRFQFDVSRAIYKGILRYLAHQENREAVVQPLAPQAFAITPMGGKKIRLSWSPSIDPIEPSATAQAYKIYQRKGHNGFDQGVVVTDTVFELELEHWEALYSFKITAWNSGGESFPSETLAAGFSEKNAQTILIVNAFDRISGPQVFDSPTLAGLAWWEDTGVPYQYNYTATGRQHDYHRHSPWLHDDSPGWGASFAEHEAFPIPGNSFDFTALYGESILQAEHSFVSMSRKAFEQYPSSSQNYWALCLIGGLQKGIANLKTPEQTDFVLFSPKLTENLRAHAQRGGHLLVSGAYIGTDMINRRDESAIAFTKDILGFTWRTNHASHNGAVQKTGRHLLPEALEFNTQLHPGLYRVEAPDGIEPANEKAHTIYRYQSNQISAGVLFESRHKAISLGFPFETLISKDQRDALMQAILNFFQSSP